MSHRTGSPHGDRLPDRKALLDNRSEHAPKRHRTRKRRSRQARAKAAAAKQRAKIKLAAHRKIKERVLAYWRGDAPDLGPNH